MVVGSLRSTAVKSMLPLRSSSFMRIDDLLRHGLDRVLHLNLQHQVAAAPQIEAQPDVLLEVALQFRARSAGMPMMP